MTIMRTHVKICGLTRIEDACCAWQAGADLLGFIFVAGSPRCLEPEQAAEITAALRQEGCTCRLVGVFAGQSPHAVRQTMDACGLHLAQLHGGESPDYARALDRPHIVALRVRGAVQWDVLDRYDTWGYLLDSFDPQRLGGSGKRWDWDLVDRQALGKRRVLIAGGINPENVARAVRQLCPWGVDCSSGVEARPGIKDHEKVRALIARVREAKEV